MPNRAPPTALTGGATTDGKYGVFYQSGYGNPSYYHQFFDDFDNSLGASGLWVPVFSGTGAVTPAGTPADGGVVLMTPGSQAAGYAYMQLPVADYTFTLTYKMFFGARFTLTDSGGVASPTVVLGLTQHQAAGTPAPTDGIYFQKNTATSYMDLIVNKTSAPVSVTGGVGFLAWNAATGLYSTALVSGTTYDCGYYVDFNGNIWGFFGTQLFGFLPQSGSGPYNTGYASGNLTVSPPRGPQYGGTTAAYAAANPSFNQPRYPQVVYPTAVLSPMVSILAGDTNSPTLSVDFIIVQKER
jgi:hypothetical protein